jgi:hypothetical protein
VVFPALLARAQKDPSVYEQIPTQYDAMPRKNSAAFSGLARLGPGDIRGISLWATIEELLEEIFPDSDVSTGFGSIGADKCTNHAERKIVRKAGGAWTILGIGASRQMCPACERAIHGNSPAAILAPFGINYNSKCQ